MAFAYQKKIDLNTSFALWKIEETAQDLIAQLQLKEHERSFIESLNGAKRNLHWLSTRVLLRKMLNTDEYIDCKVDDHGKPYLASLSHHISFSLSYDYAAVMISRDKSVGIDIELVKNKIERIAHKFMSENEMAFIDQQNRAEHLYICWSAKEANFKLHGKKQISFLNHIILKPFNNCITASTDASLQLTNGELKNFIVNYEKIGDYIIGYVTDSRDEE